MPRAADQRVERLVGAGRFLETSFYSSASGPNVSAALNSVLVYKSGWPTRRNVSQDTIIGRTTLGSGKGGFWWRVVGADAVQCVVVDGTPTAVASASYTLLERQTVALGATYDGANLRIFDFAGQVGADAATAGGATVSAQPFVVGGNGNAGDRRPPTGQVCAYQHSEGAAVLSGAAMAAHLNAIIDDMEQGRELSAFAGCEYYIDAADLWQGPGSPLAASWVPRIDTLGVGNLAKTGEPEAYGEPARF